MKTRISTSQINLTHILLVINALLVGIISGFTIQWSGSRHAIAYVESAVLLDKYQGMMDARKAYQEKVNVWQANIDTLMAEWQRDLAKYERELKTMTPKKKKIHQELLQQKQKQTTEYQQAIQQQAQQEDRQMTMQVVEEINRYIEAYGKREGYKVILAATEVGNVVYAEASLDITEEILQGLNKAYTGRG